jgi:hypothetical protein
MKNYNTISPLLDGLLSDDHLYFEGVRRPVEISRIGDGQNLEERDIDILEKYFNDVYNLLLRKLSTFASFEHSSNEEITKMQALLQELIKVKDLIYKISKIE